MFILASTRRRFGGCTELCNRFGPMSSRLTAKQTAALAQGFLSDLHQRQLADRGDADFAYATEFGRFRTSVVRQRLGTDHRFSHHQYARAHDG